MTVNIENYSISAFFPAYNDAGSIAKIIHMMARLLPKVTDDYEIVVVDDGSVDGTGDLLRSLALEYPFLKVIYHGVNRGYGAALITGFANCSKDLIFYTDGDGQYDVEELLLLLENLGENTDIVNGYKISRSDSKVRIIAGEIYRHLMRFLFGLHIKDVDCDFRLFRHRLLEHVQLSCDSGVICVEMMKKFQENGCRMVEVPIHHYQRGCGKSQFFRFRHLRKLFIQLFAAWWKLVVRRELTRPSTPPALQSSMRGAGMLQDRNVKVQNMGISSHACSSGIAHPRR
jgi:glycosyltransferase involved in cell wall biosynthesis